MERDDAADEALRVINEVLWDMILSGQVAVRIVEEAGSGDLLIEIVPSNLSACPISVLADSPPEIDLFVGREPIRAGIELWHDDRRQNLTRLGEMVGTIAAGGYEQAVVTHPRDRIEVTGFFGAGGAREQHSYSGVASGPVEPGQSYTQRFEAY